MRGSKRARRVLGAVLSTVVLAVAAVGCTGEASGSGTPSPSVSLPPGTTDTVTVDGYAWGKHVELTVGPIVVADGIGVLHLEVSGKDASSTILGLGNALFSLKPGPSGVRLVDIEGMSVSDPARAGKDIVTDAGDASADVTRPAVAFAAPTGTTAAALIPGFGLVEQIPVVDAEDYDGPGPSLPDLTDTSADDLVAPSFPLESFTQDASVSTRVSEKEVAVAIDSDVLFAVDSADLSPEADTALIAAAARLAGFTGGTLTIVGHTDDVGETAYNQDLSQRRAQAVADRMAALADLSAYDVTVEGRGESEPAVQGTDAASRALNRRVELVFVPTGERSDGSADGPTGETPAPLGPVASGTDPLTVTLHDKTYQVRVEGVRRTGGMLVGTLEITTDNDGPSSLLAAGAKGTRGGFSPALQTSANRVTLLTGSTATYPLDYLVDDQKGYVPLADRVVITKPAGPTLVTVIWPDPGTDAITIDLPPPATNQQTDAGSPPFRFTDVPVADG